MTRVRCYIDGLNFYYGIAQKYNCKWIDLEGLLKALLQQKYPNAQIEKILLFTAEVVGDPDASLRQSAYLNALQKYSPGLELVLGKFQNSEKSGELLEGPEKGKVRKFTTREEKRTDVNLACRVVEDAYTVYESEFDIACVVTNDSDIAYALEVKERLKQNVVLIAPRIEGLKFPVAGKLTEHVPDQNIIREIKKSLVKAHLLPKKVGKFSCPNSEGWHAPD